jgi:hypothetical protein
MEGAFPCFRYAVQETKMIQETKMKFALIGAAAFAAAAFTTPALAQAVIEDPAIVRSSTPTRTVRTWDRAIRTPTAATIATIGRTVTL